MERGLRNQVLANYVQRCGFALMLINGTAIYLILEALIPVLAPWPTMLVNVAISAVLGFTSGFALGLQYVCLQLPPFSPPTRMQPVPATHDLVTIPRTEPLAW